MRSSSDARQARAPAGSRWACVVGLAALVAACGGGGGGGGSAVSSAPPPTPAPAPGPAPAPAPTPTTAVAVTVIDGAIRNALVCLDKNGNDACDAGEPSARTGSNGQAQLQVDAADAGRFPVLALVGTDAVDADFGAVTTPFALKAPADRPNLVTPLTTMVQALVEITGTGTDAADAAARAQIGLGESFLRDYTSRSNPGDLKLFAFARALVLSMQRSYAANAPSIGQAVPGGPPVTAADLYRLGHQGTASLLSTTYALVGRDAVRAAVSSGDVAQIDAALKAQFGAPTGPAAGVATTVAWLRALGAGSGVTTPGAWTTNLFVATPSIWSVAARTFSSPTAFTERSVSSRGGVRREVGSAVPSRVFWNGSAWAACAAPPAGQRSTPDAAGRVTTTWCNGALRTVTQRSETDVSGQALGTVTGLSPGSDTVATPQSNPTAVFPAGSRIATVREAYEGTALWYDPGLGRPVLQASAALAAGGATACAAVPTLARSLAWGTPSASLDAVVATHPGTPCVLAPVPGDPRNEWWEATTVPLARYVSAVSPGPSYTANRLLRAGFGPGTAVTYYMCLESSADASARNCNAIGTGSTTTDQVGDAAVLRFQGLPVERVLNMTAQANISLPVLVQRGGQVYVGESGAAGVFAGIELNATAANAVLAAEGIAPLDLSAPLTLTAASFQGDWVFWDAAADYASAPSTTVSIGRLVDTVSQTGFSCTSNAAGVAGPAVACSLAIDPATKTATVTLPSGTATLQLDLGAATLTGTLAPAGGGPVVPLRGGLL